MKMNEINIDNLNNAIDLIQNVNYHEFEDVDDLRLFHNKVYQYLMIVKTSLEIMNRPVKIDPTSDMSISLQQSLGELQDFDD